MASAARDDPLGRLARDLGDQIEVMVVVEQWHVVDGSRCSDHDVWNWHSVLAAFCEQPLNLQCEFRHFSSDVEQFKAFKETALAFEVSFVSCGELNLKNHRKACCDPVALADLFERVERCLIDPGLGESRCVNQNQMTAKHPS